MAAESRLQSKIIKYLRYKKWVPNKIILCSQNGWPDISAYKNKRVIFIEVKSPKKKPKKLQEYVHDILRKNGFEVYVIDNWQDFLSLKL